MTGTEVDNVKIGDLARVDGVGVLIPVDAAATGNVTPLSGAKTVDGVALTAGDRVLLPLQSTSLQRGVWVVQSGSWTRPKDFPDGGFVKGRSVVVLGGTGAPKEYALQVAPGATCHIGVSAQTWTSLTAGSGIAASTSIAVSSGPTNNLAQLNQALINGDVTVAHDVEVNGTIAMPDDRTLFIADAEVKLSDESNCNLVRNAAHNQASAVNAGNSNIRIEGLGKAFLNGNAANQTKDVTALWKSNGIELVNVDGVRIKNIRGNARVNAIAAQVCTDVQIDNFDLDQTGADQQAGIEVGPGCSDWRITGLRGDVLDDVVCVMAHNTNTVDNGVILPYTASLTAAQRDTHDITVRNTDVYVAIVGMRIFVGDGSKAWNVRFVGFNNQAPTQTFPLYFGPAAYVTQLPRAGDIAGVVLDGYTGPCETFVTMDAPVSDLQVSRAQITTWKKLLAREQPLPGSYFIEHVAYELRNIGLTDIEVGMPLVAGQGDVSALDADYLVSGLTMRNVRLAAARSLMKNAGPVNGVGISGITVGHATGSLFQSTGVETGVVDDVHRIRSDAPLIGTPTRLRFGRNMPILKSTDTVPIPTVGSRITCDQTLDPTGGGGTTGGEYTANKAGWVKTADLATVSRAAYDPTAAGTLIAWFDASQRTGLASGDPESAAPDLSGNNHHATQGTASKRPSWISQSALPSGSPVWRFDGIDDLLQTAAFTQAVPYTMLVVCMLRALRTGYVVDGSLNSGQRASLYNAGSQWAYYGGGSNLFAGAANTAKSNLPVLLTVIGIDSLSAKIRQNGVEIAGNPSTGSIGKLTLGSRWDETDHGAIDIAEVRIYQGAFSGATLTNAEADLIAKHL